MCHPSESRPLSVHECARLQGFPDDWHITGSVLRQYTQIGNAVPVALGKAIGESLGQVASNSGILDHAAMLDVAVKRLRASARNNRSSTPTETASRTVIT
jgi:DNA (cytosine-5)-methyltransferase 1